MSRPGAAAQLENFRESFREEARELLAALETSLLGLHEQPRDAELVAQVFRGLHTIKGSGAMFGFDDLAAFTHDLETVFDDVRRGRLAVTVDLVDLTLAALDRIRAMVEMGAGETAADRAADAAILDRVRRLGGKTEAEPARAAVTEPPASADTPAAARPWRIRFAPGPDLMRNGADPLLLLRELGRLGRLTAHASLEALPPLAELDPERCYAVWEMVLETSAGENAIRDVFIFVEDTCELIVEAADAEPEPGPAEAAPPSPADRTARALNEKRSGSGRRFYDQPDQAASLRVPAARLDQLVNLVGELVTVQARLSEIAARREDEEVVAVAEEVERLSAALRENSMTLRMMPIRGTFERFRRLVHDLARELGKDVELTIEGAETELDKTVIDQLSDPLMHLIRNSMDHGIEPPEVRRTAGKRPTAQIHLSARHSGGSVLIGVSDDGGGVDTEAVRRRAVERGLIAAEAALSETEIFDLLFQPGFSTARQVTDLSGRGVGMDVVRRGIESLRGTVEVSSRRGAGTTVTMRLPLTLAIIDGLLVTVGDGSFVLPLSSTLECIELTRAEIEQAGRKRLASVRGELVPYIRLREHFAVSTAPPEREQIMVVESPAGRCGLVVDRVLGNCQTVIRTLGRLYRHVHVVSGATILGNGTVALILDPQRLVQAALRAQEQNAQRRESGAGRGDGHLRAGP